METSLIDLFWRGVRLIAHISGDMPLAVPLLLVAATVAAGYWTGTWSGNRRWAWRLAAIIGAVSLGDGLLLEALPRLGLSFGPVALPWALITLVRAGLLGTALLTGIWFLRRGHLRPWYLALALNGLVLAGEVYGLCVEPFQLSLTRKSLTIPDTNLSVPLRLVHLTDLHIERTTRREEATLARLAQLQPDMIMLTGDYLNLSYLEDETARRDARTFLSQLHAPYGVYAVSGTVETPGGMQALFAGLSNITVLDDQTASLVINDQPVYMLGVTNHPWSRDDSLVLRQLKQAVPPGALTVLLYHTPDLIETAAALQVDLYLAGHTHGGQVRLPKYGALITSSRYGKQYEAGLYQVGATYLYVSRGLGMEGAGTPRVRFLCPPEIVELTLTGP